LAYPGGRELTPPVGPIGPIGPLEPPEPVAPTAEIHGLGPLGSQLREGQMIAGRVLRSGSGRAVVRFGDQQFEVPTRESLEAGDHVVGRAVSVDGRIVLQLRRSVPRPGGEAGGAESRESVAADLRALGIEPTDAAMLAARTLRTLGLGLRPELLDALARLLTHNGALSGELAALARSLDEYLARYTSADRDAVLGLAERLGRMLLAADDPELARAIARYARECGVFTEARLRLAAEHGKSPDELLADDLKWALLKLRARLHGGVSGADAAGRAALVQIERTLAMIQAHQLEDVYGQRAGYFMLELPFREGTGFDGARVRFFYRRGKAGEPAVDVNNCTVLIDVTMSRLGEIKVLLTAVRGTLSCQIMSARPEVVDLLETEVEGLRTALESLPFRVAEVACIETRTDEGDAEDGALAAGRGPVWPAGLDLNG